MHRRIVFLALVLLFISAQWVETARAAQIRVAWDPNTESDLSGYKVYYGTAPWEFGEPVKLRNVTNYTLTGLTKGTTYYIAITAYDRTKHESGFSNQVSGIAHDLSYGEWVFDVSSGDKGGAVIHFDDSDNTLWGYGITNRFDFFEMDGTYDIDENNVISGTYKAYDFGAPQSVLASGSLNGEIDKKGATMSLEMENWSSAMKGTLFLKDPYKPKYPLVPEDWTVKVSGNLKGTFDPMMIERYSIDGEPDSHIFKISGISDFVATGSIDFLGLFLLTLQNKVYGVYDMSGAAPDTGFFSGSLDRTLTKFTFRFSGDGGKKYTFTGQAKE